MLSALFLIYFTSHYLALTSAQNNTNSSYSTPCLGGPCIHTIPAGNNSLGGTLELSGTNESLSDITNLGGWEVLDCHPTSTVQNITMKCVNPICSHLFEGGSEGTYVKLPENCGAGIVGHVSRYWGSHNNQTIGTMGDEIHAILLETNLTAIYNNRGNSTKGPVSFRITGSNRPDFSGQNTTFAPTTMKKSNTHAKRQSSDTTDASIFDIDAEQESNSMNININQQVTPYSNSITCDGVDASITLTAGLQTALVYDVGFEAEGDIALFELNELNIFAGLAGSVQADIGIAASINDQIGITRQLVGTVGLPGLDFKNILQLGPSANLYLSATVDLNAQVNAQLTLEKLIGSSLLYFPPQSGSFMDFMNTTAPFGFSASEGASLSVTSQLDIIPNIAMSIGIMGASASVYIEADGGLGLTVSGSVGATESTDSTTTTAGACVDLKGSVSVTAGIQGNVFDILKDGVSDTIYSTSDELYSQCIGSPATSKRSMDEILFSKRAASCFGSLGSLAPVVANGTATKSSV